MSWLDEGMLTGDEEEIVLLWGGCGMKKKRGLVIVQLYFYRRFEG